MKRTSPKEFIEAWQTSQTINDVMQKTGMKKHAVLARAKNYRTKGVPLKKMQQPRTLDWKNLAEYAENLLEEKADE